ncbi:MAG: phosphate acyltransferase [Spirochaetes bacterium]|nr:phosphate acyltransferase [Spirochaetota bacterium]
MMLNSIDRIVEAARDRRAGRFAIAAAQDVDVLKAAAEAAEAGIAEPILIGDPAEIGRLLSAIGGKAADFSIVEAQGAAACALAAAKLVGSGKADFLMKGKLGTADLMRAVLDKDLGLRTGRLLSHVMLYEMSAYPRMLALTDGGMNTFPDLAKKADILENAALLFRKLGYESMTAACICGAEIVDPQIQSTLEAASLVAMKQRWIPYGLTVFGPVGLDLAVSPEACRHKGYGVPGGGSADILLVPTYEVGNGIGKALTYFGGARSAGIIVGASVPIVLVSRSDTAETKLASIALAAIVSGSTV